MKIHSDAFSEILAYFQGVALHRSVETLTLELRSLRFSPFARVRRQYLKLLREVKQHNNPKPALPPMPTTSASMRHTQTDRHNAAPKWRLPRSIRGLFFGAIAIMIHVMTKWHFAAALAVGLIATTVSPIFASISASRVLPDGMQFTIGTDVLRIQVWTGDVVRVTYGTGDEVPAIRSLTVVATPTKVFWKKEQNDRSFTILLPRLRVKVDKESGAVSFADVDDHLLLSETAQGRAIASATEPGVSGNSCAQSFQLQADEGVYGLGQHQQGLWNYRSGATQGNAVTVRLAQANTEVAIPVIASSKGYMLLWDNPAVTSISLDPKAMRWSSEFGRAIDYYFCYGDGTTRGAMKAYRHLTGDAPLMPRWMLGFWQCKEHYNSQRELLEVAKNLRELKVPVDGIIQDWQYWPPGNNTWGSHRFDPAPSRPGRNVQATPC